MNTRGCYTSTKVNKLYREKIGQICKIIAISFHIESKENSFWSLGVIEAFLWNKSK